MKSRITKRRQVTSSSSSCSFSAGFASACAWGVAGGGVGISLISSWPSFSSPAAPALIPLRSMPKRKPNTCTTNVKVVTCQVATSQTPTSAKKKLSQYSVQVLACSTRLAKSSQKTASRSSPSSRHKAVTSMIRGSDRCICMLLGFCCSILILVTKDGSAKYGTNFGSAASLAIMSDPNAFAIGLFPPMPPIPPIPPAAGKTIPVKQCEPVTLRRCGGLNRQRLVKMISNQESHTLAQSLPVVQIRQGRDVPHALGRGLLTSRSLARCFCFQDVLESASQRRISW